MDNGAWWLGLALTAAGSGILGYMAGRARSTSGKATPLPPRDPAPLLAALAAEGAPLDILPGRTGELLARCVVRSLEPEGLACELTDAAISRELAPGRDVACLFAPRREGGIRVSAFHSSLLAVDAATDPPRLVLALPAELLDIPRRRHARKRVSDQRFVRVRLWAAQPDETPLHFPDAAPDIWVNAYDGHEGEENAVTDISSGGMALEVRSGLLPTDLEPGSPVVLKCSLFQFREKQFRPYWYAGVVRGVTAAGGPEGRLRRIAIGFTHVGSPNPVRPQGIAWTERAQNEIQGEDE